MVYYVLGAHVWYPYEARSDKYKKSVDKAEAAVHISICNLSVNLSIEIQANM